jgi:hypothetical protein
MLILGLSRQASCHVFEVSSSCGLSTVDVKDLTRDESGPFQIQNPVNDVTHLAEPTQGVFLGHAFVGSQVKAWILDDTRSHCVHADPLRCELYGK